MTIGELEVDFELREDVLLVVASGTVSFPAAHSLLENILDIAQWQHASRILVDTLAVEGTFSQQDRRDLGRALADYVALGTRVKVAFVGKPTAGAGVMTAQSDGVVVELFSTRADAITWLDKMR